MMTRMIRMWRHYTPSDKRDALLSLGLLLVFALMGAAAGIGGWAVATGGGLAALGPDLFQGRDWSFWLPAGGLGLVGAAAGVGLWLLLADMMVPTGTGFVGWRDLWKELSAGSAKKAARVTRPDLSGGQRRRAAPGELGIPLHESLATGWPLWLPLENATGVIAPQQSGKSLTDLFHKVLQAPGGLVVTGTKLDIYARTALHRERRESPVWIFDLTGAAHYGHRVRWDPTSGCTSPLVAQRRAEALMVTAGGGGQIGGGGNHQFFLSRATAVLTCYLLAAALGGVGMDRLVAWTQDDSDPEATEILQRIPQLAPQYRTLREAQALVPETRSGIWESLRDGMKAFADSAVVDRCMPAAGEPGFDMAGFIASRGTLYVIGSESDATVQAGLITAFIDTLFEEVRRDALHRPGGRQAPPFSAVLDEVTNIAPLPKLPDTLSDSAGRGLLIHWAAQSVSQLVSRWGQEKANTMLSNTTAITIFGGIKEKDTLEWVATMSGDRDVERKSTSSGGLFSTAQATVSTSYERQRTLPEGRVRELRRGTAVVIMRHVAPVLVRLRPAWKLREWKSLEADAAKVKATRPAEPVHVGPHAATTPGGVAGGWMPQPSPENNPTPAGPPVVAPPPRPTVPPPTAGAARR